MTTIVERYGCTLRIYDNGGRTTDRYTCIPPRWATDYKDGPQFEAIGASETPFSPQGVGMCCTAHPGKHLGKRIHWDKLPEQVQQFAKQTFPEYCPQ